MCRFAILVALIAQSSYALAQQSLIPGPLLTAINRLSPTASLLQTNEIDLRECDAPTSTPGLVKADFNGDGLEDAAVLLKVLVFPQLKGPPGEQYREANFLFVVFLNDGKGGYRALMQDKYYNHIPSMMYMEPIRPTKIRNIETGKDVVLRNPGVMLIFCGKSAAAYSVTGNKVSEIPISD